MRNTICILLIFMLASCAPKNNSSTQASVNDTIITYSVRKMSPTQPADIILPAPPEWLTPGQLAAVSWWKNEAKLELYTYMDFFNSISSLISTTTKPDLHSIRQISNGKKYISLFEIFSDTVVYYVAMFSNPPQTELLFGYQKYTIKDNYLFLAQSVPVIWIDDGNDMDCGGGSLSAKSAKFYLTDSGVFFLSIDMYTGCGEEDPINSKYESNGYTSRYFYNCNGQKLSDIEIESYADANTYDSVDNKEVEIYRIDDDGILEISSTDYSNGYPDITKRAHVHGFDKRDSTQTDYTYTEIYRFNAATQKYEKCEETAKQ